MHATSEEVEANQSPFESTFQPAAPTYPGEGASPWQSPRHRLGDCFVVLFLAM